MRNISYAQVLLRRTPARVSVGGNAVAHIEDDQLQAHLGRNLIAIYQPVVEEALPERVRNLLNTLDRREIISRPPPAYLIATVSRLFGHAVAATVGQRSPEPVNPPVSTART